MSANDAPGSLARAKYHVARFEEIVKRQKMIVERLRTNGCATEAAERLLETMERSLALARDDVAVQEGKALPNRWLFFRDISGRWQWERRDEEGVVASVSQRAFPDADTCRQDAVREGYEPGTDNVIFPSEFEQKHRH